MRSKQFDGVRFGQLHSWQDFGLVLTDPPDIGSPKPKLYQEDVPGSDGLLDLTEATTGEVKFSNRTLTFQFDAKTEDPIALEDRLLQLHGQTMEIVLDESPDYYYEGRVEVQIGKRTATSLPVTVTVDAAPYKMRRKPTRVSIESIAFDDAEYKIADGRSNWYFGTYFDFGTQFEPGGDFSDLGQLRFYWSDDQGAVISDPCIIMYDALGQTYTVPLSGPPAGDHGVINISTAAQSVDLTKIWRISVRGRWQAYMVGAVQWDGALISLQNERKRVIPSIYLSTGSGVLRVGSKRFAITAGSQIIDTLTLGPGRVDLLYKRNGSDDQTLTITYREGRI